MFEIYFLCLVPVCIIKTRRYSETSIKSKNGQRDSLPSLVSHSKVCRAKKLRIAPDKRRQGDLFSIFACTTPNNPDGRNFSEFAQAERMFRRLLWQIPLEDCSPFSLIANCFSRFS